MAHWNSKRRHSFKSTGRRFRFERNSRTSRRHKPSPILGARDEIKARDRQFTRRVLLVGGVQCLVTAGLVTRLHKLQIQDAERYQLLADRNRIQLLLTPAPRGRILDRNNLTLAEERPSWSLIHVPEQGEDKAMFIANLKEVARLLSFSDREVQKLLAAYENHPRHLPMVFRQDLSWREVSTVEVNAYRLSGMHTVVDSKRDYVGQAGIGHVTGYVTRPSEEDERLYPKIRRVPGIRVGRSGLEGRYEPFLQGRPGAVELEVNASGRSVRELSRTEGEPGQDLKTTLDADMQRYAWQALQRERSSAAVVLDVRRGDVLAMASYPATEPQIFSEGISSKKWQSLQADPLHPLTNKAIAGQYAPGSTIKPVIALAALQSGLTPSTEFFCPGHFELGSHRFHCWKKGGHGRMDMRRAMQQSCDVYFYRLGLSAGLEKIAQAAYLLGLGEKTGIGLAHEVTGLIPSREWKRDTYNEPWHEGETVNLSIGQGFILATPLQLAVMAARLASGMAVSPVLVRDSRARGAAAPQLLRRERRTTLRPPPPRPLAVMPHHLAFVRDALDGVVNEQGGTAFRHRIGDEGLEMAGKTGTSQVRRISVAEREQGVVKNEDLPWRRRDHALFIGYAPVYAPRFAAAVVVEHGGSGSAAAAPIVRDLLLRAQRTVSSASHNQGGYRVPYRTNAG